MNWITENQGKLPLVVFLTVAALVLAAGGEDWRHLLRFDRLAIADGEWWRWVTAHLVHSGWSHTAMNLAGLWVVWLLFSQRLRGWPGVFIAIVCIGVMDAGFWFRDTQLGWYVGMSGLLHGFFAAGAWDELWKGIRGGGLLVLAVVAKLLYEQFFGALPLTAAGSGGPVWVNSHLYGALGGFLAATLLNLKTAFRPRWSAEHTHNGDA
ncbi:MAG: rhombosortase [Gammaproteobacteria bacterium]|nr:rhombosortase [Gammaproteobacteria bacterium]